MYTEKVWEEKEREERAEEKILRRWAVSEQRQTTQKVGGRAKRGATLEMGGRWKAGPTPEQSLSRFRARVIEQAGCSN
jgi:hypothetical protein